MKLSKGRGVKGKELVPDLKNAPQVRDIIGQKVGVPTKRSRLRHTVEQESKLTTST